MSDSQNPRERTHFKEQFLLDSHLWLHFELNRTPDRLQRLHKQLHERLKKIQSRL